MASLSTPPGKPGWPAPPFDLPGVDGRRHTLQSVHGRNGLVVMFICNHCPYVKGVLGKIVRDADALRSLNVNSVAIMSNDPAEYEADSFLHMKEVAIRERFAFPYVLDETQDVGRAYGAVCTPDFFGFDRDLRLVYRGRLDASGRDGTLDAPRELYDAMAASARGEPVPEIQHPSIGCSIKWRG